jgi:hypothetical protein
MRLFMKFIPHHLQHIAAAKAGFSERTARRMETNRHLVPQPIANRSRRGPDPFEGLWDSGIRPMLEALPGLLPVGLLEEMQRRHSDHDWNRLRRSLERRVRAWRAEHGADREVIFRQDHVPGQQALSDFTDMADAGVSIAGQTLNHRLYHFVLAYSAWKHAEPVLGGEGFAALAVGLQNALFSPTACTAVPLSARDQFCACPEPTPYKGKSPIAAVANRTTRVAGNTARTVVPAPGPAGDLKGSPVQDHQFAADCQTQTCTAKLSGGRSLRLAEGLEEESYRRRFDTNAVVIDQHGRATVRRLFHPHNRVAPVRAELDRVVQQI